MHPTPLCPPCKYELLRLRAPWQTLNYSSLHRLWGGREKQSQVHDSLMTKLGVVRWISPKAICCQVRPAVGNSTELSLQGQRLWQGDKFAETCRRALPWSGKVSSSSGHLILSLCRSSGHLYNSSWRCTVHQMWNSLPGVFSVRN